VGLSRLEEEWATAELAVLAAGDPDGEVRKVARMRLERAGNAPAGGPAAPPPETVPTVTSTTERLRSALDSPLPFVRERAADLLGDRSDNGSAEVLRARLTDSAPAVRAAAARALAAMGDPASAPALLRALDDERWRATPSGLAAAMLRDIGEALAVVGGARVFERLLRLEADLPAAVGSPPPDPLRAALERLVDREGTEVLDPLRRHLGAGRGPGRIAARLIGRIADRRAQSILMEHLDARGPVSLEVLTALGECGDLDAFADLLSRARSIPASPEADVAALDAALARLIERHGPALTESKLREAGELWWMPDEIAGDIIEPGPGFHAAPAAAKVVFRTRERLHWIDKLAEAAGRPPGTIKEVTPLRELSTTWSRWLFLFSQLDPDLPRSLLSRDQLLYVQTVGQLVDLIIESRSTPDSVKPTSDSPPEPIDDAPDEPPSESTSDFPYGVTPDSEIESMLDSLGRTATDVAASPAAPLAGAAHDGKRPRGMKFWELVSAFREESELVGEVLSRDRWRDPYLAWYATNFSELVRSGDRAILDALLPLELSREVALASKLRFALDEGTGLLRRAGEQGGDPSSVCELSASEVHDRFGGWIIEEVLEYGSARV
jgi:HEAT repeat protein